MSEKRDFLKLANYSLSQQGRPEIRSATTVYNRARPRNKRSKQAKNHTGLGLFCTKKPPKSEGNDNELTHFQKAHKKLISLSLFGNDNGKYVFLTSDDDKAYLCPGTSTGFRNTRNTKIFQPTDQSKARVLPKYDFPNSVLNVTPGTHRVMEKEVQTINGVDEVVIHEKQTICWFRSKHFIGSSGTVWANESLSIPVIDPSLVEVVDTNEKGYSKQFRRICYTILIGVRIFLDSCMEEDIKKVETTDNCPFRVYELTRTSALQRSIRNGRCLKGNVQDNHDQAERRLLDEIFNAVSLLEDGVKNLESMLQDKVAGEDLLDHFRSIEEFCETVQAKINEVRLPIIKPIICELTDAGPGVGSATMRYVSGQPRG